MRKGMKRFLSIMLALVMVVAMTATVKTEVMAADECTITISGNDTDSVYSAYKLLDLTVTTNNAYNYTVNSKYSSILMSVLGTSTDAETITKLSGLTAAELRTAADSIYAAIKTAGINADKTTSAGETTMTVAYGYYLIAETSTSGEYSAVMLDTAVNNAITVTTKESTPTMTKQVVDVNDSTADGTTNATLAQMTSDPTDDDITWQDTADYDVGDDVLFKLEGTVSEYYSSYSSYYYVFHDEMCDGLSFNKDSVKVYVLNGTTYTEVDSQYYSVITTAAEGITDDCTFEVIFDDLKDVAAVTSSSKIIVYYTAKLTGTAVVYGNPGNENEACLEYSNNPYNAGSGDTGTTPKDGTIVFTYKLVINKVDENNTDLEGATFKLEKYNASTSSWDVVDTISGTSSSVFTFSGLDDGDYKLSETPPTGYNGIEDVYFTVEAGHVTTVNPWAFSASSAELTSLTGSVTSGTLTLTGNTNNSQLSATVKNTSTQLLPTTGGIGTTILYIIGAILVVGAGVLLVTRRRVAR